jgi:hypothetical protein
VLPAAATSASCAFGDGDPASDWLIEQSTYLSPADGNVNPIVASQLVGLLAQAQDKGLSLKVAVVVTPADLGSDASIFKSGCSLGHGQPLSPAQCYAEFLAEEDFTTGMTSWLS